MSNKIVVFITAASKAEAEKIATSLVAEKLVACVNIVGCVQSIFNWQGRVNNEPEVLMIAKTIKGNFDKLAVRVKALHSYDVPEIIALPIVAGSSDYLNWIDEETKNDDSI